MFWRVCIDYKFHQVSKPAARLGDGHACPMVEPNGTPHVGGPIIGPGCVTVIIEGQPAATTGDACSCVGPPDKIMGGSSGVFIGGKPAARSGDSCEHGGVVIGGSATVFIGERLVLKFLLPTDGFDDEPSDKEKIAIVSQVIKECIALLENKLPLLIKNDPGTIESFVKWFGPCEDERKAVIVGRMERQIAFFKELNLRMFDKIAYEGDYQKLFAMVYATDECHTIYLGNHFWKDKSLKKSKRETVLIHEISHFKSIGRTKDYDYDGFCEDLPNISLRKALFNADSYAFFLTGK
jgi:uncharacterized Zn-binding protein involved in type VI secretion